MPVPTLGFRLQIENQKEFFGSLEKGLQTSAAAFKLVIDKSDVSSSLNFIETEIKKHSEKILSTNQRSVKSLTKNLEENLSKYKDATGVFKEELSKKITAQKTELTSLFSSLQQKSTNLGKRVKEDITSAFDSARKSAEAVEESMKASTKSAEEAARKNQEQMDKIEQKMESIKNKASGWLSRGMGLLTAYVGFNALKTAVFDMSKRTEKLNELAIQSGTTASRIYGAAHVGAQTAGTDVKELETWMGIFYVRSEKANQAADRFAGQLALMKKAGTDFQQLGLADDFMSLAASSDKGAESLMKISKAVFAIGNQELRNKVLQNVVENTRFLGDKAPELMDQYAASAIGVAGALEKMGVRTQTVSAFLDELKDVSLESESGITKILKTYGGISSVYRVMGGDISATEAPMQKFIGRNKEMFEMLESKDAAIRGKGLARAGRFGLTKTDLEIAQAMSKGTSYEEAKKATEIKAATGGGYNDQMRTIATSTESNISRMANILDKAYNEFYHLVAPLLIKALEYINPLLAKYGSGKVMGAVAGATIIGGTATAGLGLRGITSLGKRILGLGGKAAAVTSEATEVAGAAGAVTKGASGLLGGIGSKIPLVAWAYEIGKSLLGAKNFSYSEIGSTLLTGIVPGAAKAIYNVFGKLPLQIGGWLEKKIIGTNVINQFEQEISTFFDERMQMFKDLMKGTFDFFVNLQASLVEGIQGYWTEFTTWLKDLWFKDIVKSITDCIAPLTDAISGYFNKWIDEHPKIKAIWEFGKKVVAGINETVGGVVSTAGSIASAAINPLGAIYNSGIGKGIVGDIQAIAKFGKGGLAAAGESRGDIGAVGSDSTGGASYGAFQIATKTGTMKNFMEYLSGKDKDIYSKLSGSGKSGSKGFTKEWKNIASQNPEQFLELQRSFIEKTHIAPVISAVKSNTGVNLLERSKALQEVLWSTAIQHGSGGATKIFTRALKKNPSISDSELIPEIYKIRSTQFGSSTPEVQASVMKRFANEQATALSMMGEKSNVKTAPEPAPIAPTAIASNATPKEAPGVPVTVTPPPPRANTEELSTLDVFRQMVAYLGTIAQNSQLQTQALTANASAARNQMMQGWIDKDTAVMKRQPQG